MTKKNPFLNMPENAEEALRLTSFEAQKHLNDDMIGQSIHDLASDNVNVLGVQSYINPGGELWSNITFEFRYHPHGSPDGVYVWRKYVMEWGHAAGPLFVGVARGQYIISRARYALENGTRFRLLEEWKDDEAKNN